MKYKVALVKTDEGFSVSCPGLPGCWSQGATEQEAIENIRSAIQEYLAVAAELVWDADARGVEVQVQRNVLHNDLDFLAGSWSRAEADGFDEELARQRKIDPELWE